MNIVKIVRAVLMMLCLSVVVMNAQTTIQSTGTGGAWNNPATWDGGTVPGDLDSVIILSGDSVWVSANDTCAGLNIEAGGSLATFAKLVPTRVTLNGTLTAYADTFFQSSTMTVGSTGMYNHAMNGGRIPSGVWEPGSTMLITGLAGNGPSNGNQNFYNVTWNCPNQTANLNLGWDSITIGGDVKVLRTCTAPNSFRWNMCAPLANDSANVTIMGNIIVKRGALTSNGTSNPNTKIDIFVHGNVIVDGEDPSRDSCNFSVSRGSQGGTGTSRWYLYGDFYINNATTQNSNPLGARYVFMKPGTQNLTVVPGSNILSLPVEFGAGTTLNTGTSTIRGNGRVYINAGGTLMTANAGGLDSTFITNNIDTLKFYSTASNYIFNGTSAQAMGRTLPGTVNNITIDNASGASASDSLIIDGALTLTSGDLNLGNNVVTLSSTGSLNESAGNTVIGKVKATRNVTQSANESFGGLGLTINAAGAAPGMTTVERVTGTAQSYYSHQSLLRYFDITPTTNSGLDATLDYFYDDSELNSQNASSLSMWKSEDGGSTWQSVTSSVNTGLKRVRGTGIDAFSRFTAADSANALNINSRTYSMNQAWNMVSLPLTVADAHKTVLFPTATSEAFAYNNGYTTASTLVNGKGYWLKFPSAQSIGITGSEITSDTIHLVEGWNMVGALSDSVVVASITEEPDGIVQSQFFGYNNGYFSVDKLAPSRGYWVKAGTGGGDIILSTAGFAKASRNNNGQIESFNRITITDSRGYSQTLYLGESPKQGINLSRFELPPSPPAGVLDVRYGSQRYVETYQSAIDKAVEYAVNIQSAVYPVTVRWEINDGAKAFTLTGSSGVKQNMSGNGALTLHKDSERLAINVSGEQVTPKNYSLSKNYPNPFNPSTAIRVELPAQSQIRLRVFTVLGEEVAQLASGVYEEGYHTFSWQGTNAAGMQVSSGVYFYSLEATSLTDAQTFSAIHKMVLMK